MKLWAFACIALAIAITLGLMVIVLFPMLHAIAPTAPKLVSVEGAQTAEFSEGRIRYQKAGTGKETTLFLHGFNNQLTAWNPVWDYLKRSTEPCGTLIRIDIPGYGGSAWNTKSYTLPDQAKRVIAFLDQLGISQVTLVGASMGGSLSGWIAAHYPERIKSMILLAPSGYPGSLQYAGLFGKILRMTRPSLQAWIVQIVGSDLYRSLYPNSTALQALSVTQSYGENWAEALKKIRAPSWLLWSQGDLGVPFAFASSVHHLIPKNTFLALSPQVGHDIPSHRPELIAKITCQLQQGQSTTQILDAVKKLLISNGDTHEI